MFFLFFFSSRDQHVEKCFGCLGQFGPRFMAALRCWLRHCEAYMFFKLPRHTDYLPANSLFPLPLCPCAAFCARSTPLKCQCPTIPLLRTGHRRADQPPCRCTCRHRNTHTGEADNNPIKSHPQCAFVFPTHEAKLTGEGLLASPRCQNRIPPAAAISYIC